MRTIERSSVFKRDFKREVKGQHRNTLEKDLVHVITLLVNDRELPAKYRDHALSGDWVGYRECHVKPDLLLTYKVTDPEMLRLARLGSHSELNL